MLYFYVAAQNAANRAQKGAGMAEYALLLALVAVLLIGAFTSLKDGIAATLTDVVAAL